MAMANLKCDRCGFETDKMTVFAVHACAEPVRPRCTACGERYETADLAMGCYRRHVFVDGKAIVAHGFTKGDRLPHYLYVTVKLDGKYFMATYEMTNLEPDEEEEL
jgi:uncharacterized protein (DUF983 family)